MKEQEFVDIELTEGDSLAEMLRNLIDKKREETGSYNVFVHNVIPVSHSHFTVILTSEVTYY